MSLVMTTAQLTCEGYQCVLFPFIFIAPVLPNLATDQVKYG